MGSDDRRAGRTPEFNRNPNPTQAYEITLALEDAPGEFKSIEGFAGYSIINKTCLPPSHPISGVQTAIASTQLPIPMVRKSGGTYVGQVYVDAFRDADYFGRGECRLEFVGVRFELQATGAGGETRFMTSLRSQSFSTETAELRYYWRGGFPRQTMPGYPDSGFGAVEEFKPELQNNLFAISLSARAMSK